MKLFFALIFLGFLAIGAAAQSDLDKMIETERSFARMASEKGTRAAFLEYMAPDAVVFDPDKSSARAVWTARAESPALLSWAPNFADISSSGILGYTTGNWEYRPKGKEDTPTAFGDFFTIWVRQPSGQYRWALDFGVGHSQLAKYSVETVKSTSVGDVARPPSAVEFANGFFKTTSTVGLKKAYNQYAAEDVRFLRNGQAPGLGRKALVSEAGKVNSPFAFAKRSIFFESGDLAYVADTYQTTNDKGVAESGNSVQVWKYRNGRWQIVFDIVKPLPAK